MRLNTCPLIFAQIRLTVESRTAFCCGCCLSDLGKFWGVWCLSARNFCIISDETIVIYKSLLVPISQYGFILQIRCANDWTYSAILFSLFLFIYFFKSPRDPRDHFHICLNCGLENHCSVPRYTAVAIRCARKRLTPEAASITGNRSSNDKYGASVERPAIASLPS